jgi:hypothetical protein
MNFKLRIYKISNLSLIIYTYLFAEKKGKKKNEMIFFYQSDLNEVSSNKKVLGNKQNRLEKITKPSFLFFCDPFVK